jgi:hypothetical protein
MKETSNITLSTNKVQKIETKVDPKEISVRKIEDALLKFS